MKEDLRALNLWSIKQTPIVFIEICVLLISSVASLSSPSFLVLPPLRGPLLSLFSVPLMDIQTPAHSQLPNRMT